jgi:hypothetical protein
MKYILVFLILFVNVFGNDKIVINNAFYGKDVNEIAYKDTRIAIRAWLDKFAEELNVSSTFIYYVDFDKVKSEIKKGHIDYIGMSMDSYFKHKDFMKKYYEYGWTRSENNHKKLYKYLVITKKGMNKSNLNAHLYKFEKVQKIILEKYALKNNIKIKKVKFVDKKTKPVLDVFFNKCDIAVIKSDEWDIMVELNPQLAKKLQIVYETDKIFLMSVFFLSKNISKEKRDIYFKAIKNLSLTKNGKEFMKFLNLEKFIKLNPDDLRKAEKFYDDYLKLKAKK